MPKNNISYKNILILRLDRIGDVALSTPVFKAVKESCPGCRLTVLVSPYTKDLVYENPFVDEVIAYDKKNTESGFVGNVRFIIKLLLKRFDLAIVLHPTVRSHIITFFSFIPRRIGYDKKMGILLTDRIPHLKQLGLRHEIDYNLSLLEYAGIIGTDRTLLVPITKSGKDQADTILKKYGIKATDSFIVVNPGASCPSKRWPVEKFAQTLLILSEKYGLKVLVISAANDRQFADRLVLLSDGRAINISSETSLGALASILKQSKLLISNDSGPVHIACAVGTPVVDIFGRSDRGLSPQRWGPSGRFDAVHHKDAGCDICLAHNCVKGFLCLDMVSVDEVALSAQKILNKNR